MKTFNSHLNGFHDVADQLSSHLRRRAADAFTREAAEKAALTTVAAFEARRQRLRDHMRTALGGLPDLPDDVAAVATGRRDEADFSIEKLLIETLPGVHASALLYLPRHSDAPAPAVLFVCGHAREAKAYPQYQRVCRSLARAGLVVLALDPVGQGERLQYLDPRSGEQLVEWGTIEHAHAGFQCHVAGANVARYFVADGMQALTYLRSRPEVDAERLGITGNSGGGTQASYLMFLDDRYTCGAPFTYITSRDAYIATGQPHDSEQNLHGAISVGLNHDDLAGGLAPRPVMLGAVASDFFDIEGTLQSYERLERIYDLYGRSDHLHLAIAPGRHAYAPHLREQATRFFRRHLLGEEVDLAPGVTSFAPPRESPIAVTPATAIEEEEVLPPEELQVTRRGQVALDLPEARTVFDLNRAEWHRRRTGGGARGRIGPEDRERLARTVLGKRPRPPMWVRDLLEGEDEGIRWRQCYTFTEPDIAVAMIELLQEDAPPDAPLTVIATEEGTEAVHSRRAWTREQVERDGRVLLFDPRGAGAVAQRPINPAEPEAVFGTLFRLNYDAMMMEDSLFAMIAFDALRVLEYAHRIAPSVRIYGEGTPGALLLCAALLDGDVAGGCIRRAPASWERFIEERFFRPDYRLEAFGLAALPDARAMAAALPHVVLEEALGARGEVLEASGG